MVSQPMSRDYTKSRGKARSPLGEFVAGFLNPAKDNRALAIELFGEERAGSWIRGLARLRMSDAEWGNDYHDENSAHVGRFFAWVSMVLEQVGGSPARRACGRQLYQGRTRRWDSEQKKVVYVPAHQAGGVAARLGVSPRTVQRYVDAAKQLGMLSRWQITKWQEVQALPKKLRGKRYSYSFIQWAAEIPRAVQSRIDAWWGKRAPEEAPRAALGAPPGPRSGGTVPPEVARAVEATLAMLGDPPKLA